MKKSRYSDDQVVRILREADSVPIAESAKRHGVSDASVFAWRKRFGEMVSDDIKRLKALEVETNHEPRLRQQDAGQKRRRRGDEPPLSVE